ncbi:MAG TPA: choice-of-anchor Q domain-containing protein [Candidatus Acidoferrales bacterium]|nr:choice-of-anchor Q domain-containing protein [Candidatus Acidoferrales bacterium]
MNILWGLFLGILALLSAVSEAAAAELRVPGDFPTIQEALDAAMPGDTILVDPGTYTENLQFKGKDVRLESTGGPDATTIKGTGGTTVDIGPAGTIDGFTITGGTATFGAGMSVHGAGTIIAGNVFDGNQQGSGGFGAAIGGNNSSPIIQQNVFQKNSCDGQFTSGVVSFVNTSSPRIVNNIFQDNPCRAINMTLPAESLPQVINNTIVRNVSGVRVDRRISTILQVYRNNLIVGNQIGLEIEFGVESFNPTWENNLVFDNGTNYSGIADQTGLNGNISADPLLVDFVNGDYHLQSGSPAIGAGSTQGAPEVDFDGVPRGDSIDIGAFQFVP